MHMNISTQTIQHVKLLWWLAAVFVAIVFCMFLPSFAAGESGCSGVNYFSCVTGGSWGSVGEWGTGTGNLPLNIINDPTPGGTCSCAGCLCVPTYTTTTDNTQPGSTDVYSYTSDNVRLTTTVKDQVAPVPADPRDARTARRTAYFNDFYEGFYPVQPTDTYQARAPEDPRESDEGFRGMGDNVTTYVTVTTDKWGAFYDSIQESLPFNTIRDLNLDAPGR